MKIYGIREHITKQLDTVVTVLREHRIGNDLVIVETEREPDNSRIHLDKVIVKNIPTENVWIFENEFNRLNNLPANVNDNKSAFSFAGKKVEKTVILHRDRKLYLLMIEMKRTLSPKKYRNDVIKKYEQSIESLSVFISAHFSFTSFEESEIYPVGICCYNYYETTSNFDRDPNSAGSIFRTHYENNLREILLEVQPLTINQMQIPIILCENPNTPLTTSFEINLEDIINRIQNIVTRTSIRPAPLE